VGVGAGFQPDCLYRSVRACRTTTCTYDALNRFLYATTPWGNFSFSYDANGNLSGKVTSTGTWTFGYDPFNRLTGVQWNGVTQASYAYNGKGQRVSKTAGGVSSSYLWDGANLAQENRGGTYTLYSTLGDAADRLDLGRILAGAGDGPGGDGAGGGEHLRHGDRPLRGGMTSAIRRQWWAVLPIPSASPALSSMGRRDSTRCGEGTTIPPSAGS